MKVVVPGITVVVFIHAAPPERHRPQHPGLNQFAQRAVDGRPADLACRNERAKVVDQLFGVEVIVMAEHHFHDQPALAGQPLAPALQELYESLGGRKLDIDRSERETVRHDMCRLTEFIEQPLDGDVELLLGFVAARSNLGPDLIDPILAHLGHVLDLIDQARRLGCLAAGVGNA